MILDDLPFGTAAEIEPGIVELVMDEGIEVDRKKIQLIERGLHERYDQPYGLLVNRLHAYSHTPESMKAVASMKRLHALAIVVYSSRSESIATLHQAYMDQVAVFRSRETAHDWLVAQMAQVPARTAARG